MSEEGSSGLEARRAPRGLPPLLPNPRSAVRLPGRFALGDGTAIVLSEGADDGDFASACILRDRAATRCGIAPAIETHTHHDGLGPFIALRRDAERGDRYRIDARNDRVELWGQGPAGLRYAVETLLQLLDSSGRIPCCAIEDAPDFELRGIMLDISRGKVPTRDTLHELVDLCAQLKLNVFMLYTEHTFRFRRHPEIGRDSSPLDAQTLRELDAYAASQHVDLVPSLQSLGHMEHVLALPRYRHLAESGAGWTLAPTEPGTLELLRDLYDEYLPNFRSRFFNANCDEPFDLGRGKSSGRSQELGPGGLYLEHVNRLRELVTEHGKRTMIWGDVVHAHPNRIPDIDRDLILLDWWYERDFDYERVKVFSDHGIDFVVCPGTSSWNCLFPRVENSDQNIAGWAAAGRRHGALGLLNTDWGDFGHYNLQGNSWLAYAWGAQQSWSGDADRRRFDRAFSRLLFGDEKGRVARLYRELGAIHDPGFSIPNGSALQYLYFDEVERSFFISACKRGRLARCERSLESVRGRIEASESSFGDESQTWRELLYAANASLFSVRKARAGLDYNDWRRTPGRRPARDRRRLARILEKLASEQTALTKQLEKLWLARSQRSNFDVTRGRLRRAAQSLRRAARKVEADRPSTPPPIHRGFELGEVFAEIQRSVRSASC